MQGRKSTLCNLLVRQGVLDPLSIAMQNVSGDQSSAEAKAARRSIFKSLNILSRSDGQVRVELAKGVVPRRLLRVIDSDRLSSDSDLLYTALQCVKNLSMAPECAEGLRSNGNAVEILTHLLIRHLSDEDHRVADEILTALYYLCRLPPLQYKPAQQIPLEEAAEAGIVPVLLDVANSLSSRKSVVKPFAVSMLCDMVQAGNATRQKLWPKGLHQYLGMVSTDYWQRQQTDIKGHAHGPDYHCQAQALVSICTWLQADFARIERELLKPGNLSRLAQYLPSAVNATSAGASSDLLSPFLHLTRLAPKVINSLVETDHFIDCIQAGLSEEKPGAASKRKNDTRLNLLRLVRAIVDTHPDGSLVLHKANLLNTLRDLEMSTDEGAVIVKGLAGDILHLHSPSPSPTEDLSHFRLRASSQSRNDINHAVSSGRKSIPPPLSVLRGSNQSVFGASGVAERSKLRHEDGSSSPSLPSSLRPSPPLSGRSLPPSASTSPFVPAAPTPLSPVPRPMLAAHSPRTNTQGLPSSISSPTVSSSGSRLPGAGRRVLRTLPVQPKTPGSSGAAPQHARARHGASIDSTPGRGQEPVRFGSAVSQRARVRSGQDLLPHRSVPNSAQAEKSSSPQPLQHQQARASSHLPPASSRARVSLPTSSSTGTMMGQHALHRRSLTNSAVTQAAATSAPSAAQSRTSSHNTRMSSRPTSPGFPPPVVSSLRGSFSGLGRHAAGPNSRLARPRRSASLAQSDVVSTRSKSPNLLRSRPSSPTLMSTTQSQQSRSESRSEARATDARDTRRPVPVTSSRLFSSQLSGLPRMPSHPSMSSVGSARGRSTTHSTHRMASS